MLLLLGFLLLAFSRAVVETYIPLGWCKDPNAEPVECATSCPATCNEPYGPEGCIAACALDNCVCKEGFVLDQLKGTCIRREDCPNGCNGDPNAVKVYCASSCPPTCGDPNPSGYCIQACAPVSCACKEGYIFNQTRMGMRCVKKSECPRQCYDPSAEPQPCPSACQPTCSDRRPVSEIPCPTTNCLPGGCVCQKGFILDRTGGKCIPPHFCPGGDSCDGDFNKTRVACASICPATCASQSPGTCQTCIAYGCDCKPGYIRTEGNGTCIKEEDCHACNVTDKCKRTCASPNPRLCPYNPTSVNNDGCNCAEGYVLSDINGKCIRIEECPPEVSCNGDPNARAAECPAACPATCDAPNELPCKTSCDPVGCECKDGYILSSINGKCIPSDNCPNGDPCPDNESFVSCSRVCPSEYCPTTDFRGVTICDGFAEKCSAGCICNLNYKRKSLKDPRCIVSSDCPPVACTTRINEEWGRCPTVCLREDCINLYESPTACNTLVLDCDPRCVCQPGYFRNGSDLCVAASECSRYTRYTNVDWSNYHRT